MKIFASSGLSARAVVDLMTQTTGQSIQNFDHLKEALKKSAGVADGFGVSFQELTVILGAMANAGVRGELAGMALNGALARLANPVKLVRDRLTKLVIAVEEVNPLTNKFRDIIDRLHKSGANTADILIILGQIAGPKFVKLIKDGGVGIDNFAKKQREANTALEASRIVMKNTAGKVKEYNSAMEAMSIAFFGTIKEDVNFFVSWATEGARVITKLLSWATKFAKGREKEQEKNRNAVVKYYDEMIVKIDAFWITLKKFWKFTGITDTISAVFDRIKLKFEEMTKYIKSSWESLSKFFKGLDFVKNFKRSLGDTGNESKKVTTKIKSFFSKVKIFVKPAIEAIDKVKVNYDTLSNKLEEPLTQATKAVSDYAVNFVDEFRKTEQELLTVNELTRTMIETATMDVWQLPLETAVRSTKNIIKNTNDEIKKANVDILEQTLDKIDAQTALNTKVKEYAKLFKTPELKEMFGVKTSKKKAGLGEFAEFQGQRVAQSIVGVSGAIQGFQAGGAWGAAIGALTEILMANAKFQEMANELNEMIIALLDPILNALAPTISALVHIIEAVLAPVMEEIGFWLNEILVELLPIWIELVPIFRELMQILRVFRPYIQSASKYLGMIVHLFLQPIKLLGEGVHNLSENIKDLSHIAEKLSKAMEDAGKGGPVGGALGDAGTSVRDTIKNLTGYADGGEITSKDIIKLPGMGRDDGLIKAQIGETVIPKNGQSQGNNFVFNINAIDPSAQKEEIWQIIEEGFLTGRLAGGV
jgi:hypothetical protein